MSDSTNTALALSIVACLSALVGVCMVCARRLKRCHSGCMDAELGTPVATRQASRQAEHDVDGALLQAVSEAISRSRSNSNTTPPQIVVTTASTA